MIYTEDNVQLNLFVEDDFDWLELFDTQTDNSLTITVNESNIDFFFPNWRDYVDKDNILETLNFDDADRFETIKVTIADNVMDKDGEGVYEIQSFKFGVYVDDDDNTVRVSANENFGDIIQLHYEVTPDLPIP